MKTVLLLVLLNGAEVQDSAVVKIFDTKSECEYFIDSKYTSLKRMDVYLKYYRDNKDKIKKEFNLSLTCKKFIPQNFA